MSDAEKIISALGTRYPCSVPGCEGTAALVPVGSELLYACDSCRALWNQDGAPWPRRIAESSNAEEGNRG